MNGNNSSRHLQHKIARYRRLARQIGDDVTKRRIEELVSEMERDHWQATGEDGSSSQA